MAITSASWRKDKGSSSERGYTWAWQKARRLYLSAHPLCVMCSAVKKVTAANVVDHIIPHGGNQELFWDEANWQPLCKQHHDTDKAEQEGRHAARAKFSDDGRVIW
jgi:5-methylcytosine-specific restriction protein A